MNGRITINGYVKNGGYELLHTGEGADPAAHCSLNYSIYHGVEVLDLLHMMKNSIERDIEAESDRKANNLKMERINSRLVELGIPTLSKTQLNVIFDEINTPDESEDDD